MCDVCLFVQLPSGSGDCYLCSVCRGKGEGGKKAGKKHSIAVQLVEYQ